MRGGLRLFFFEKHVFVEHPRAWGLLGAKAHRAHRPVARGFGELG